MSAGTLVLLGPQDPVHRLAEAGSTSTCCGLPVDGAVAVSAAQVMTYSLRTCRVCRPLAHPAPDQEDTS